MSDPTPVEERRPEWGGFDEAAVTTMHAAREEARARNHEYVGTEDVLIGLLFDPDYVARRALGDLGVDVGALTAGARTSVPPGAAPPGTDPVLSPRAKNALMLAVDEARRLNAREVGTEHLLIGLLGTSDGRAHTALTDAGITLDAIRAAIRRRLSDQASSL